MSQWPQEWLSPSDAAAADYASQTRLQAMLACAMLVTLEEERSAPDRATERRLGVYFDRLNKLAIVIMSLRKTEGR
jgi:hypothetical protein